MVSGRLESNRPDTPAEKRLNLKSVGTTAIFRLEARCDDPAGERMNLHLSLASYDPEERQIAVEHTDASPIRKETTYSVKLPIRRRPSASVLPCRRPTRRPVIVADTPSVQTIVPHPARTGGNRRAANTGQPLGRHAANRNDLQITVVRRNAGENPSEYFRNMDRRPTKRAARYLFFR